MLAHDYFPVQVTYYGFWYRSKAEGSMMASIKGNKAKQEHAMSEIRKQAKKNFNKVVLKIAKLPAKIKQIEGAYKNNLVLLNSFFKLLILRFLTEFFKLFVYFFNSIIKTLFPSF